MQAGCAESMHWFSDRWIHGGSNPATVSPTAPLLILSFRPLHRRRSGGLTGPEFRMPRATHYPPGVVVGELVAASVTCGAAAVLL
jgi:hypothetical protein